MYENQTWRGIDGTELSPYTMTARVAVNQIWRAIDGTEPLHDDG